MTREGISQQIAALQRQLDEIDKAESRAYASASLTESEKEKQHQEDLQRLRGLRLIDDDFMNACFDGYTDGAQLLLRIILNKQDIHVKSVKTQKRVKNLLGRDICLDIDADDDAGKEYNVDYSEIGITSKYSGRIKERTENGQDTIPVSLMHICSSRAMLSATCRKPL